MMDKWKLVPVEPTEEMRAEICSGISHEHMVRNYKLMLAAAPQPPALGGEPEVLRYMFDWARAICCDGPRNWITCIERELPHPDFFKDGQAKNLIELVDRAHVARLQAEVERMTERSLYNEKVALSHADSCAVALTKLTKLDRLLRLCLLSVREQRCDDDEAEFDLPAPLMAEIDAALAGGKEHE